MEDLPDHVIIYMTNFLSGYDLCVLSNVNVQFRQFCSNYEKILKIDKRMEMICIEDMEYESLELFELEEIFDKIGPYNAIICTRPLCTESYLKFKNHLFTNNEDSDTDESEDENVQNGIIRINHDNNFCKGSIFTDPTDGNKWCEYCMTKFHGEEWKSWDEQPRIAKNCKFYVKIKDIKHTEEWVTERYTEYNRILDEYVEKEYTMLKIISVRIELDNGIISIPTMDGKKKYKMEKMLILDKREYSFEADILVPKL